MSAIYPHENARTLANALFINEMRTRESFFEEIQESALVLHILAQTVGALAASFFHSFSLEMGLLLSPLFFITRWTGLSICHFLNPYMSGEAIKITRFLTSLSAMAVSATLLASVNPGWTLLPVLQQVAVITLCSLPIYAMQATLSSNRSICFGCV